MALPLEFMEAFEQGTKGNFNTESDSGNRLDFPHQRDLSSGMMPWRGAYCMRVNLGKSNTDAYLEETVSWASGQTRWGRFKLYVGDDVQFGNNGDRLRILGFYSAGPTLEGHISLARVEPFGTVLVTSSPSASDYTDNSFLALPQDQWLTIEFCKQVDSSAGGVLVSRPNIGQLLAAVGAEGTITAFRLGAIDQVGDIAGTIYFDDFLVDEDRLYDDPSAYNGKLSGGSLFFVQSSFAFIGEGAIDHVTVVDGGSNDCRVQIYDAYEPTALPAGSLRYDLRAPGASRTEQSNSNPVPFKRGAYVKLSGTNPQAIVRLGSVASDKQP